MDGFFNKIGVYLMVVDTLVGLFAFVIALIAHALGA